MLTSLTIEEVTERLIDYRGKTPPKTSSGVRLLTAKVIKNGVILPEPAEYIAEDFYDEWMRRGLPQDLDILITTEARLGEVALLRLDLRRQFETMIDAYNVGSTQIDQLFRDLLELTRTLTDEEARHVREQLSEEELVVFDLLTRPGPELSTEERNEVKKVASKLLGRLRGIFTIDWQRTTQARARVRDAIEETLDEGLPRAYTPDVFKTKAGVIFRHVYERYTQVA